METFTRLGALALVYVACIAFGNTALAQNSITFKTNKPVGTVLNLTIGASGDVAIDGLEGKFDNYKTAPYKVQKENITITGDIESFTCNASGVTEIDVTKAPNLVTLKCDDNKIVVLDLEQNAKLKTLFCQINKLNRLDVDKLTNLRMLACAGNRLSELNLEKNLELRELYCHENAIRELKVDHLLKLTKLTCAKNKISKLDVSKNIGLGRLFCSENNLSSLDVSHNTMLMYLGFSENHINTIDLKNNKDLEIIFAQNNPFTQPLDVSQQAKLEELYIFGTESTSIDLTHNPKLKIFSCSHNAITALDVSQNPLLKTLFIQDNQIGAENMSRLVAQLPLREEQKPGVLIVKDIDFEEHNVCMEADVAEAKKKFWGIFEKEGEKMNPYEGIKTSVQEVAAYSTLCHLDGNQLVVEYAPSQSLVVLYDLAGNEIAKGYTDLEGTWHTDVAHLAKGSYLVRVAHAGAFKIVL